MSDQIKDIIGISNRAGQVQVQNVLSPLLWLCAICIPIGVIGLFLGQSQFSWVFVFLILSPLGLSILGYIFFALKDPNRLQSESYMIETERLQLMSKQQGNITDPEDLKPVNIDSLDLIIGSKKDD